MRGSSARHIPQSKEPKPRNVQARSYLGFFQPIPGFKQLVFTAGNTFFLAYTRDQHGDRKPFELLMALATDSYLPLTLVAWPKFSRRVLPGLPDILNHPH